MKNENKEAKTMSYEEFKKIIKKELEKSPDGLTWTQIREKRPELYQKFPNNQWVHKLEEDIRLVREKVKGRTIWKLK